MKKYLLASVAALALGVAAPAAYAVDPLTAPVDRAPDSQDFENPAGTFNPPQDPGVGGAGSFYDPTTSELETAITNAGIGGAVGNKAVGYQDGDDNTGDVDQVNSAFGHAFIQQVGDDGNASIKQTDTGSTPPGNTRNNRAQIFQFENTGPATAVVEQDHTPGTAGADNIVEVHQEDSLDAEANVYQRGAGNKATVLQSDSTAGPADATIEQGRDRASNNNAAVIYQNDNGGTVAATVEQDGDDNLADVLQFDNSGTATAEVLQDGDRNNGLILQYSNIGTVEGTIEQNGDDNDGWIFQGGQLLAEATILQIGNANTGEISQTGTSGPGNFASISQNGNGNAMSYVQ